MNGNQRPASGGRRNYNSDLLRRLAANLSACGEIAIWHFILDCERGRPFPETVSDFARLNPQTVKSLVARHTVSGGVQ